MAGTSTKRTTTAKSNVVDFDAARSKPKRFNYKAFGRTWKVKAPNQIQATQLFESKEASSMIDLLGSFIDKNQRDDFLVAAADDEDFGVDEIMLMVQQMMGLAYPDIPT